MDQIPNRCQCQLASSNINDFKSQNLDQASNGKDFDLHINNIFPKEYSQYNSFEIQHAYMVNKETLSIESTTSQRAQKRSRCNRDAPFMVSSKQNIINIEEKCYSAPRSGLLHHNGIFSTWSEAIDNGQVVKLHEPNIE